MEDISKKLINTDYENIDIMVDELSLINVEKINNEVFGAANFIYSNPVYHEQFRGNYRQQLIKALKAMAVLDQAIFEFGSQMALFNEIVKLIESGQYED